MVITTFIFNLVHPGVVIRGKAADLPSRQKRGRICSRKPSTGNKELGQGVSG